jgi:hypothetical protein
LPPTRYHYDFSIIVPHDTPNLVPSVNRARWNGNEFHRLHATHKLNCRKNQEIEKSFADNDNRHYGAQ